MSVVKQFVNRFINEYRELGAQQAVNTMNRHQQMVNQTAQAYARLQSVRSQGAARIQQIEGAAAENLRQQIAQQEQLARFGGMASQAGRGGSFFGGQMVRGAQRSKEELEAMRQSVNLLEQGFVSLTDEGTRFSRDFMRFMGTQTADAPFFQRFNELAHMSQQEIQEFATVFGSDLPGSVTRATTAMTQDLFRVQQQFPQAFEALTNMSERQISRFLGQVTRNTQGQFVSKNILEGFDTQTQEALRHALGPMQEQFQQFANLSDTQRQKAIQNVSAMQGKYDQFAGSFQTNMRHMQDEMAQFLNMSTKQRREVAEQAGMIQAFSSEAQQASQHVGTFRGRVQRWTASVGGFFQRMKGQFEQFTFQTFSLFIAAINMRTVVMVLQSMAEAAFKAIQRQQQLTAIFKDQAEEAQRMADAFRANAQLSRASADDIVSRYAAALRSVGVTNQTQTMQMTQDWLDMTEQIRATMGVRMTEASKLVEEAIKGNADQLGQLGLNFSEMRLDEIAQQAGGFAREWSKLPDWQKQQVLIRELGRQIQDLPQVPQATLDSLIILDSMGSALGQLKDTLGQVFTTGMIRTMVQATSTILRFINTLMKIPGMKELVGVIITLTTVIGTMMVTVIAATTVGNLFSGMWRLLSNTVAGRAVQALVRATWGLVTMNRQMTMGAVNAQVMAFNLKNLRIALLGLGRATVIFGLIQLAMELIFNWEGVVNFFRTKVIPAIQAVFSVIGHGAQGVIQWIAALPHLISSAFGSVLNFFANNPLGQALLAVFMPMLGIPNLIIQNWERIKGFVAQLIGWFRNLGQTIFDALTWPFNRLGDLVKGTMEWVRGFFPFSDPKRGPLKGIRQSGTALLDEIAKGMEAGKGRINDAMDAVARQMQMPQHPGFAFTGPQGYRPFADPSMFQQGAQVQAGAKTVVFAPQLTVQAHPDMSEDDARRQGEAAAEGFTRSQMYQDLTRTVDAMRDRRSGEYSGSEPGT